MRSGRWGRRVALGADVVEVFIRRDSLPQQPVRSGRGTSAISLSLFVSAPDGRTDGRSTIQSWPNKSEYQF